MTLVRHTGQREMKTGADRRTENGPEAPWLPVWINKDTTRRKLTTNTEKCPRCTMLYRGYWTPTVQYCVCVHHTFLNRGNCHEEETVCESKQFSIRASVALSMAGRSFCQTAMTFWEVFFLNVSTLQSPRPQHISVCSALFCNFLDQSDKMSNTGTCRASVWEKPTSRRWKESDLTTSAFLFHSWSSVEGFNPDVVLYGFVMTSEFMGF